MKKDNIKLILQFAKGQQSKKHKYQVYSFINGEKTLIEEKETDADMDITIEIVSNKEDLLRYRIEEQ